MAIDPNDFEDIAKRFDKLTPEERDELLERLEKRCISGTGTGFGDATNGTKQSLFDAMNSRGMAGSIKD